MEYQLEDKIIINTFLNNRLFNNSLKKSDIEDQISREGIELIIRPECNQTCEYCYIYNYGKELYPIEERIDNKQILNNLKSLLQYFNKRYCYINHWELFAGDLFYDNLYFDIADIFYDYFLDLYNKNNVLFKNNRVVEIITPCNFSFCHDKEKIIRLKEYIAKFKKINVILGFSWSHDGKYSADIREKEELSDEFYKDVFTLINEEEFGIHAMISYEGIDNAIQNFDWWVEQYNTYLPDRKGIFPYSLEVRNSGWTKETIDKYLKLLNHVIDYEFNLCNKDPKVFAHFIYNKGRKKYGCPDYNPENDFSVLHFKEHAPNKMGCTLGHALSINLSNLTFVPCHRLTYPQFRGAKFILEEAKTENEYLNSKLSKEIIDIDCDLGMNAYLNIEFLSRDYRPGCSICEYKGMCLQGCLGSQYETFSDFNIPIPEVCQLLKAKIDFIINKYNELKVLNVILTDKTLEFIEEDLNYLRNFLKKKGIKVNE